MSFLYGMKHLHGADSAEVSGGDPIIITGNMTLRGLSEFGNKFCGQPMHFPSLLLLALVHLLITSLASEGRKILKP